MKERYNILKAACYSANVSMSVTSALPPLLCLAFRESYGISFSLLGTLVLISFFTQLIVDLVFSFYCYKFNIPLTVKIMPLFAAAGFILYAAAPVLFPSSVFVGLVIGTVLFSAGAGLGEVLISPVVAAIPSDNPEREMSKLHSVFAWGCVGVIIIATLFILIFGSSAWQYLVLLLASVPVTSAVLYSVSNLPPLAVGERASGTFQLLSSGGVWLCILAIFLGGASECTMSQWSSSYIEAALGIPKAFGDVFGVALFSVALGLGRTLYSKFGRNIERVLFWGTAFTVICYLFAIISPLPIIGLISCAATGFFVSMLWPGSLIIASDKYANRGVVIYALMAAGGDLGASVGPQLVGIVADKVMTAPFASSLSELFRLTSSQLAMKAGLSVGMLFPIIGVAIFGHIYRAKSKNCRKITAEKEENL